MRYLVTGGAGYLGSVLCEHLIHSGQQVTVLDNFMYRQSPLNHLFGKNTFDVVCGDARDHRLLDQLVPKCDIVIPLAALVGASLCDRDPTGATTTNTDAVRFIVNKMAQSQQMLIPISNSGYGIGEKGKECTEETPLRPISLYGRTKVLAEQIALEHINTISFRLATVFGMSPRMRTDLLVNDFVLRAVTDRAVVLFEPDFCRNYIHIRDVANLFTYHAFVLPTNQIYNVGLSDANLSKRQLCAKIKEHVPDFVYLEAPIGEDKDKRDYIVSNAKLEATGWEPSWTLDMGIKELIKGYCGMRNTVYGNV